jgi:hypothetical protein
MSNNKPPIPKRKYFKREISKDGVWVYKMDEGVIKDIDRFFSYHNLVSDEDENVLGVVGFCQCGSQEYSYNADLSAERSRLLATCQECGYVHTHDLDILMKVVSSTIKLHKEYKDIDDGILETTSKIYKRLEEIMEPEKPKVLDMKLFKRKNRESKNYNKPAKLIMLFPRREK